MNAVWLSDQIGIHCTRVRKNTAILERKKKIKAVVPASPSFRNLSEIQCLALGGEGEDHNGGFLVGSTHFSLKKELGWGV